MNHLLEVDQLSIERAAGKVFQVSSFQNSSSTHPLQEFKEAPIDFPPTYKFIRGTGYYTGEIDEDSSSESGEEAEGKEPFTRSVISYPVTDDDMSSRNTSARSMDVQQVAERTGGFTEKPPSQKSETSVQ